MDTAFPTVKNEWVCQLVVYSQRSGASLPALGPERTSHLNGRAAECENRLVIQIVLDFV